MLLPVVPLLLPLRHPPRPLPPPPPRPVLCIVPDVKRVRVLLLECLVAKLAHRQLPLVFSRSPDPLLQQPLFVRSSFPALVNTENLCCTQAVLKKQTRPLGKSHTQDPQARRQIACLSALPSLFTTPGIPRRHTRTAAEQQESDKRQQSVTVERVLHGGF